MPSLQGWRPWQFPTTAHPRPPISPPQKPLLLPVMGPGRHPSIPCKKAAQWDSVRCEAQVRIVSEVCECVLIIQCLEAINPCSLRSGYHGNHLCFVSTTICVHFEWLWHKVAITCYEWAFFTLAFFVFALAFIWLLFWRGFTDWCQISLILKKSVRTIFKNEWQKMENINLLNCFSKRFMFKAGEKGLQ